jgi:uncharacterized phage protein (TIGR02218 family)
VKVIPIALLNHIETRQTTLSEALKITRRDGAVFGFTSHDTDSTIDGVVYRASPGIEVTSIDTGSSFAVGNMELRTLADGGMFTVSDIFNGLWTNADFQIFRYNWSSVTDGIDILMAGTIGEIQILDTQIVIELRDLRQYLQQPLGSLTSKTCRYRLGSMTRADGGLCLKDISAAPFTVAGTVTSVASNSTFTDASRSEADDYFGEGLVTWLTGSNAGTTAKVRAYDSIAGSPSLGGTFTLSLPAFTAIAPGDTFTAVAGCRKRHDEDCVIKFDNSINFGGEPHNPGVDQFTRAPTVAV